MYRVVIIKSAIKELSKLPAREAIRLTKKINGLRENPRPKECVKLTGSKNEYRIRVGNYRVLYTVEDAVLMVQIIKVGDRKSIYKK